MPEPEKPALAAVETDATDSGTKTLTFRKLTFTIPPKPTARFFYHVEKKELMQAFSGLLGPAQFEKFLDSDPEPDMTDVNALYDEVAKVYGFADSGN